MEKEHIERLLKEFEDHRVAIKEMIVELDTIKQNIDKLIPKKLDARYIRFFEEKVKSITHLFNALLEMRKEITKSVREEIDLRRKIDHSDVIDNLEDIIDVRKVAQSVEDFKTKQLKYKETLKGKALSEYSDIDIPGVNTIVK